MAIGIVAGENDAWPPRQGKQCPADRTKRQGQPRLQGRFALASSRAVEAPARPEGADSLAQGNVASTCNVKDFSSRRSGARQHRDEPKRRWKGTDETGRQSFRQAGGIGEFGCRCEGRFPFCPTRRAAMCGCRDVAHDADQPCIEIAVPQTSGADGDDQRVLQQVVRVLRAARMPPRKSSQAVETRGVEHGITSARRPPAPPSAARPCRAPP